MIYKRIQENVEAWKWEGNIFQAPQWVLDHLKTLDISLNSEGIYVHIKSDGEGYQIKKNDSYFVRKDDGVHVYSTETFENNYELVYMDSGEVYDAFVEGELPQKYNFFCQLKGKRGIYQIVGVRSDVFEYDKFLIDVSGGVKDPDLNYVYDDDGNISYFVFIPDVFRIWKELKL